jgi:endogenous inhibitor of DNA gyrase (YacG/DUF329 family)
MRFTEKYPNAILSEHTEENMVLTKGQAVCEACGEPSDGWIENDYNVFICSEECLDLMSIKWVTEEYKGE